MSRPTNRSTPSALQIETNAGQWDWCLQLLDSHRVEALWPHIEMAETQRLIRAHGYPSDNIIPAHIRRRLGDPSFCADVLCSLRQEPDDAIEALEADLALLVNAARVERERG